MLPIQTDTKCTRLAEAVKAYTQRTTGSTVPLVDQFAESARFDVGLDSEWQ
jgi:hypothetical protein